MTGADTPGAPYDSPADVARATVVLLALVACIEGISIAAGFADIGLLNRIGAGEDVESLTARSERLRLIIDVARAVVGIPTIVLFLVWQHRVYRNLPSLSTWRRSSPEWWALALWFVPLMNLVRPFYIVKEVWWVSARPEQAAQAPASYQPWGPPWLYAWWILLVAGTLLDRGSRLGTARTTAGLISQQQMAILADAIYIVAALLAIHVVRRISVTQDRAASQRGLRRV